MTYFNGSMLTSVLLYLLPENSVNIWNDVIEEIGIKCVPILLTILTVCMVWIVATMFSRWRRQKQLKLPHDNFIRCQAAIQILVSNTLPCLQHAMDTWHDHQTKLIGKCSTPTICPRQKRPSSKNKSCKECIAWATVIEQQVYPSTAIKSLQWKNVNPTLFGTDPLEVMKLFVFVIPPNKTISTIGDFDTGSVLMIMSKFSDFHQGHGTVFDAISKVLKIRNSLAHPRLKNNLDFDDQMFLGYWTDITDLVKCLQGLKRQYFTDDTAQDIKIQLARICQQPVSAEIQRQVLKTVDDHLSDFMKNLTEKISCEDEHLDLETCQKKLKEIYKDRRGGIGFLPGFPKEFSSDEFFVDIQLLEKQKTPTEVKYIELKTYTDLLKIQESNGKCLDHVLVSGLAGTGKTTLVSRLAYQWADINKDTTQASGTFNSQSFNPLSTFLLVFALDIRKVTPDLDLVDAIQDQLLQHISKQALESYLLTNADKCLFLFDGYDELGLDEKVLDSKMLCGTHVILTTRPNTVTKFYDTHQESRYIQVELKGFSKESAAQFVKKFFGQSLDQGNEATSLFQTINGKSFLKSFSQFPLLLAMMCLLWKDQKCLPTSVTSLYHQLIEYLAKHSATRIPTHKSSYTEGMPIPSFGTTYTSCKQLLILLGKTGFEGLVDKNSKLIFSEDEFVSIDAVQYGCRLGLLTKDSRVSGFDKVTEISFIHKTFQEFCAAVYLCSVGEGNSQQLKSYLLQMNIYENVFTFCCGENASNVVEDVLKHVVDLSCEPKQQMEKEGKTFGLGYYMYYRDPWKLPLTLLFEAESQSGFIESLHNLFEPLVSHITFVNNKFLSDDYLNVLEHYTIQSKTQNNWLRLVRVATIYPERNDYVATHVIMMTTHMSKLSTLTIAGGYDCSNFIDTIHNKMTGGLPRVLDFHKITCDTAVLHKVLVSQPNLTILSVPFNDEHHRVQHPTDIEALGQVLDELAARSGSMKKLSVRECDMSRFIPNIRASWTTLERLELIQLRMTMDNWQELFESIIDAGQANQRNTTQECDNDDVSNSSIAALPLKYLDLKGSHTGDSSFKLADAMKYLSSLEYLGLNSNNLDENHFNVIGPALKHLPNLTEVNILGNHIGNSFQAIACGINNCKLTGLDISSMKLDESSNNALSTMCLPTVQTLSLFNSNITSHGAKALSKSLPYMSVLKEIYLFGNNIGADGARAMSSSFEHTPQLSKLNLSDNNIGSDGARHLSASFQHIPKLSRLGLSHNNIGSDGAIALSASFKHITQLEFLFLHFNNVGPCGVEGIFKNLHHLPKLVWLRLKFQINDSQNEQSELLKACIDALQTNHDPSPTYRLQHTHDSDNEYWFSMGLERTEIESVVSVIKKYKLRHT